MHFNLKKQIHSVMEEEIYAGEAGLLKNQRVRGWYSPEGLRTSVLNPSGVFYYHFPSSIGPCPQKYTTVYDKSTLTKPVQTSNIPPNHFRTSRRGSTQENLLPFLELPWGTGPVPSEPRPAPQGLVRVSSHSTLVGWKLSILALGSCGESHFTRPGCECGQFFTTITDHA